jgi:hypothetical protein
MSAQLLSWASLAFGVAALIVYVGVLATKPRIARMVNGSGLFLNGLGLIELSFWLSHAPPDGAWFYAELAVVALCLAALAQSVVVLRNSRSWDGVERRQTPRDGQASR